MSISINIENEVLRELMKYSAILILKLFFVNFFIIFYKNKNKVGAMRLMKGNTWENTQQPHLKQGSAEIWCLDILDSEIQSLKWAGKTGGHLKAHYVILNTVGIDFLWAIFKIWYKITKPFQFPVNWKPRGCKNLQKTNKERRICRALSKNLAKRHGEHLSIYR